ncbi:MAG TPA: alpha/beta hydrolase, partial [Actinomycetes bacterium]|nr:alpha/beta hydrolase [Actinomycetes bacterium]
PPPTTPTATKEARGQATGKKRRWPVPLALAGALLLVVAGLAVVRGGGDDRSSTQVQSDTPAAGGAGEAASNPTGEYTDRKADFIGAEGLKIGATLTVPAPVASGRTAPGVLIVPGGGSMDRNGGVQIVTNLPDPLYQDLAQSFAQGGMVALRYDRRTTGESQLGPGVPLTWDALIGDAKAGLEFLAQRRETQGQPITVVGYDQGGFIAMRLAATEPRVKGAVLISTPGRPLAEVIANDFLRGVPDPAKAQAVAEAMRAGAAQVVSTGTAPNRDSLPEELRPIFSADPPYLRGLFSFDPAAEAAKVKVPTLIVRGGNDGSILPPDVETLKSALPNGHTLVSPLGSNTLSLPPGNEGRWHNPGRHGTTRDGDALFGINEWVKTNVKR